MHSHKHLFDGLIHGGLIYRAFFVCGDFHTCYLDFKKEMEDKKLCSCSKTLFCYFTGNKMRDVFHNLEPLASLRLLYFNKETIGPKCKVHHGYTQKVDALLKPFSQVSPLTASWWVSSRGLVGEELIVAILLRSLRTNRYSKVLCQVLDSIPKFVVTLVFPGQTATPLVCADVRNRSSHVVSLTEGDT